MMHFSILTASLKEVNIATVETNGVPTFISVVKAAMDIIGLRGGEVRLPLVGLNQDEKAELGKILKDLNI